MGVTENRDSGEGHEAFASCRQALHRKNLLLVLVLILLLPSLIVIVCVAFPGSSVLEACAYALVAWACVCCAVLARERELATSEDAKLQEELLRAQESMDAQVESLCQKKIEFQTGEQQRRKELEDLREAVLHLGSWLEDVHDGIISIDESGIVQTFNPGAEKIFHCTEQQVIGRNISMLMPEDVGKEHDFHLLRYMRTGEERILGKTIEVRAQRRSGQTFPLELQVRELELPSKRVFTAVVRDISYKKMRESELQVRESHLAAILDAAPDAIVSYDR